MGPVTNRVIETLNSGFMWLKVIFLSAVWAHQSNTLEGKGLYEKDWYFVRAFSENLMHQF